MICFLQEQPTAVGRREDWSFLLWVWLCCYIVLYPSDTRCYSWQVCVFLLMAGFAPLINHVYVLAYFVVFHFR